MYWPIWNTSSSCNARCLALRFPATQIPLSLSRSSIEQASPWQLSRAWWGETSRWVRRMRLPSTRPSEISRPSSSGTMVCLPSLSSITSRRRWAGAWAAAGTAMTRAIAPRIRDGARPGAAIVDHEISISRRDR